MSRGLRGWLPALLWTVLIFALSSRSTTPVSLPSGADKVAHFIGYAILGFLLAHGSARAGLAPVLAVVIGATVGALDEFYQSFVPGRVADVADWIADAAGAAAGVFVYHRFRRWYETRSVRTRGRSPVPHE